MKLNAFQKRMMYEDGYVHIPGVAPHLGPNIRYAIFCRLSRAGHDKLGWDCMTNIWAEWDGMKDILPKP